MGDGNKLSIDLPPSDGRTKWISAEAAAIWLGMSAAALARAVKANPWVSRIRQGKGIQYSREDIGVLAYTIERTVSAAQEDSENDEDA